MKLVTFRIHRELYALPVENVHSIERLHPVRPVPQAPEHILGIMNLRGTVVTVADLRTLLGMPGEEPTPDTRLIVAGNTAYLVDEALDVLDVDPSTIQGGEEDNETVQGVLRMDSELIVVLREAALTIA